MSNLETLRQRYLKDDISIRLAGLAANLLRIANFSKNLNHQEIVASILNESKWFIEWTAAELEIERAAELVGLQLQLAAWEFHSLESWQFDDWRFSLSAQAQEWSDRILKMSGLLDQKR
jgi:hypothetical protein